MSEVSQVRSDGGAAFPLHPGISPDWTNSAGMSLRDWFAGQALAMTAPAYVSLPQSAEVLAKRCYLVADAMLAARKATQP